MAFGIYCVTDSFSTKDKGLYISMYSPKVCADIKYGKFVPACTGIGSGANRGYLRNFF